MIRRKSGQSILQLNTAPVALFLAIVPAGCGGEASIQYQVPAGLRPDIDGAMLTRGTLSIPADQPFLAPLVQGNQIGSDARGEAKPAGNNGVSCRAEVRNEGSATGEFLLGYAFDNETGKALDAVVKLNLSVRETSSAEKGTQGDDALVAKSTLDFYIKSSGGVELKRENLLTSDLAKGPKSSADAIERLYEVRLESGDGYYLMLEGRSQAASPAGQSASVALEVADVNLEIRWQGASTARRIDNAAEPPSGSAEVSPNASSAGGS